MNELRKSEVEISVMDIGAGGIFFYTVSFDPNEEDLNDVVDNLFIAKGHKHSEADWSTIGEDNIVWNTHEVLDSKDLSIQARAE